MEWIKKYVSKKLASLILTPILTTILVIANKAIGSPLDDATIAKIIEGIITALIAYIVGQSAVDTAKTVYKGKTAAADVANPDTPAKASDFMDKI